MNIQNIKNACLDYFEGKADYSAEETVRDFLAQGEDSMRLFRSWEKEWKQHTPTIPQINSFNRLQEKIGRRRRRRILAWSISAAASIAVLLGVSLAVSNRNAAAPEQKLYIVETGYQERTKVILPDSTQVWLNSATRLTYTDDFLISNREVEVSGEAFFDVRKNQELPFVVKMGTNHITVRGTKFNVSAYDADNIVYAALVEGKIEFANKSINLEMNPGELLKYNTVSEDVIKCKTDLDDYTSWLTGKLDYSAITLKELLVKLSSIYGFEVVYQPHKYTDHKFRIILSTNEPIEDILDAVAIIVPMRWSMKDGVVTITEK
jgi:ferric-dicitrate binding protein FerR (iron transport regulator)